MVTCHARRTSIELKETPGYFSFMRGARGVVKGLMTTLSFDDRNRSQLESLFADASIMTCVHDLVGLGMTGKE